MWRAFGGWKCRFVCCSAEPDHVKIDSKLDWEIGISTGNRAGRAAGYPANSWIKGEVSKDEEIAIDFNPKAAIEILNAIA